MGEEFRQRDACSLAVDRAVGNKMPAFAVQHPAYMTDHTAIILRIILMLMGLVSGLVCGRKLTPERLVIEQVETLESARAGPALLGPAAPLEQRVAQLGYTDKLSLEPLLTSIVEDWAKTRELPGSEWRTAGMLRPLFSRWVETGAVQAMKAAGAITDPVLQAAAVEACAAEWALRDDFAAYQTAAVVPVWTTEQNALRTIAHHSASADPQRAMRTIQRLNLHVIPLSIHAGAAWLRAAPDAALAWLTKSPDMESAAIAGGALSLWITRDPAGALRWIRAAASRERTLPRLRWPQDLTPAQLQALRAGFAEVFPTPDAAREWLTEKSDGYGRALAARLLTGAALSTAVDDAWTKATNGGVVGESLKTGTWLTRYVQNDLLQAAARQRALEDDPAATLKWLAGLPPEREASAAAADVAGLWLAHAPATASAALLSNDLNIPVNRSAALSALQQSINLTPLKALELLPKLGLDAEGIQAFQKAAMSSLAAADPEAFLKRISDQPDLAYDSALLVNALDRTTGADPARNMAMVRSRVAPADRPAAMARIFGIWLVKDRRVAREFLLSLPAGAERDALIITMVNADLGVKETFFAVNRLPETFSDATLIKAERERIQALRALLTRMNQVGVKTDAVLKKASLTAADRASLTTP